MGLSKKLSKHPSWLEPRTLGACSRTRHAQRNHFSRVLIVFDLDERRDLVIAYINSTFPPTRRGEMRTNSTLDSSRSYRADSSSSSVYKCPNASISFQRGARDEFGRRPNFLDSPSALLRSVIILRLSTFPGRQSHFFLLPWSLSNFRRSSLLLGWRMLHFSTFAETCTSPISSLTSTSNLIFV